MRDKTRLIIIIAVMAVVTFVLIFAIRLEDRELMRSEVMYNPDVPTIVERR